MKKQKFVLAEASLDEINKQLRINMFTIVIHVDIGAFYEYRAVYERLQPAIWCAYCHYGFFPICNGQKSHAANDEKTRAYQISYIYRQAKFNHIYNNTDFSRRLKVLSQQKRLD